MFARKSVGWLVAQAYRYAGVRRRSVLRIVETGALLPIVFHAAKPEEVRAVLTWLDRAGVLPNVRLSFDDGWREFADALDVLEEFQKEAILFIAPGEIERGDIWTDGLSVRQRQSLYGLDAVHRYARVALRERRLLTVDEVKAVARNPLVKIGNHTWSHLSCTHRPVAEVLDEVDRTQAVLTEWCGKAPVDFAYPFGRGTPELDAAIRARGLTPHYTRQGLVSEETRGRARNMVYEGMSLAENIGRILMAWPKVGETR